MPGKDIRDTEYLIIGGGAAGLRAAVDLLEHGKKITVLAKEDILESNTEYAQGGVAVVLSDEDRIGLHYDDTLKAGDGLCDRKAVRTLVKEGPKYIEELIKWGAQFDRNGTKLAFTREGAHSANRILHAKGDSTGNEVMRALVNKVRSYPNIEYLSHKFALDLIIRNGVCCGALCLDEKNEEFFIIKAGATLLATGGIGVVYKETTNPQVATGDGFAMAFRAGATLMDMEFVQFHPTVLHLPEAPRFLMSESLRGEGAKLLNKNGRQFMKDYHPAMELAPRDVVSRAILSELRKTGSMTVFLDMTHLRPDYVKERFPKIYSTCLEYGLDITENVIPVRPCAHYMMGGIMTDLSGRTTIPGLYAAGECACTGVHGANRLASNSLLEGIVFGGRTGKAMVMDNRTSQEMPEIEEFELVKSDRTLSDIREKVQEIMWFKAGMNRCGATLKEALDELLSIDVNFSRYHTNKARREALNILLNARMIVYSALKRRESRGGHYRSDFPESRSGWRRHSRIIPAKHPEFINRK